MKNKKNSFIEAHNNYYTLIFNTLLTKVGNIDDARDICQEVFIKFYEKFDEIENHRKWLYGTLRLSVFEYYRKKNKNISIDDMFDDVSMTFVNGFRNARIIIEEAMENIANFENQKEETLFDLIAKYNYSYSEAGRELGLTKRMVEYKYKQMVAKILDYLKKKGIQNLEELL